MNKISQAFDGKKAFIPFITAGDPDLDTTRELLLAMQEAGADLIEIGIPFSDPVAEGPVIQEADLRALQAGTTTDKIFDMVKSISDRLVVPVVFMTYINPVYVYGIEKFAKKTKECGVSGIIVPDVPYEEKEEIRSVFSQYELTVISMIAPTSADRARMIAKEAEGFVYCVSSMGVTGVRTEISTGISTLIEQVKSVKDIPCAIGFGISTPAQAKEMAAISDGAIVGSAIVRIVAEHGKDSVSYVKKYVESMKQAVIESLF
ncbi:MAG: tryptophan synthase subunit alpha [Lachnospiraceae bacterium]|nr:tryptophan synthase subunit alpha [Lachnospiraceae bacterium]